MTLRSEATERAWEALIALRNPEADDAITNEMAAGQVAVDAVLALVRERVEALPSEPVFSDPMGYEQVGATLDRADVLALLDDQEAGR